MGDVRGYRQTYKLKERWEREREKKARIETSGKHPGSEILPADHVKVG